MRVSDVIEWVWDGEGRSGEDEACGGRWDVRVRKVRMCIELAMGRRRRGGRGVM